MAVNGNGTKQREDGNIREIAERQFDDMKENLKITKGRWQPTPEKIADLCHYRAQGGGKILPPVKIFQLQYAGVECDSKNLLEGAQEYL